jgi:hypothetical protein
MRVYAWACSAAHCERALLCLRSAHLAIREGWRASAHKQALPHPPLPTFQLPLHHPSLPLPHSCHRRRRRRRPGCWVTRLGHLGGDAQGCGTGGAGIRTRSPLPATARPSPSRLDCRCGARTPPVRQIGGPGRRHPQPSCRRPPPGVSLRAVGGGSAPSGGCRRRMLRAPPWARGGRAAAGVRARRAGAASAARLRARAAGNSRRSPPRCSLPASPLHGWQGRRRAGAPEARGAKNERPVGRARGAGRGARGARRGARGAGR